MLRYEVNDSYSGRSRSGVIVVDHALQEVYEAAVAENLPISAVMDIFEGTAGWNKPVETFLIAGPGQDSERITKPQANAIIEAARDSGVDEFNPADLIFNLGYSSSDFNLLATDVHKMKGTRIEEISLASGIPQDRVTLMLHNLDIEFNF